MCIKKSRGKHSETIRRAYVACTQVNLLRQRFEQAFGPEYHKFVDIDTIDGFQASWQCIMAMLLAPLVISERMTSMRGSP